MGSEDDNGGVRFLGDVRVIEVASLAPTALGMHLADLGADVIKVEPLTGDPTRVVGRAPGFADSSLHRRWNRGKRSIGLDLASPLGQDAFRSLVTTADVVVEGMRPGTLDKLGLGCEALTQLNPRLVYVSLSGFGSNGPYRRLAADGIGFDAVAGLAAPVEDERGRVRIPPRTFNFGTVIGPLYGAMVTVAALSWSRRSGEPAFVDVAQSDAAQLVNTHIEDLASARRRVELGLAESSDVKDGVDDEDLDLLWRSSTTMQYYRARDDKTLLLMALERKFLARLATAVDRGDLLDGYPEDRYADHLLDDDTRRDVLSQLFLTRDRDDWLDLFAEIDVPALPVNSSADALDDPQLMSRTEWLDAAEGTVTMRTPAHTRPMMARPAAAPALGDHTLAVLSETGLDPAVIDQLLRTGTVRPEETTAESGRR